MNKQHLKEAENMLFELKHAMVPQDMETTIAHGKRIDALEYVVTQTKQVDVLLAENENHFRNIKSMERRIKKLEQENKRYREVIMNIKTFPGNESEHSKMADVECAAILEELE